MTKLDKLFLLLFGVIMVQIKDPLKAGADEFTPHVVPIVKEVTTPAPQIVEIETEAEIEAPEFTQEEIDMMAQTVMNEASYLDFDAKVGIAQTIVNRVESDYRDFRNDNTIYDVIHHKKAYSTANKWAPTEECYEAVYWMIEYRPFPADMYWFCYGFKPAYGYFYAEIDGNYFNTLNDYNKEVDNG